jgi:lysophospholipase L1-like esterase
MNHPKMMSDEHRAVAADVGRASRLSTRRTSAGAGQKNASSSPASPAGTGETPVLPRRLRFTVFVLAPLLCVSCQNLSTNSSVPRTISAADERFVYQGRIDFSDRTTPVLIWQATRVSLDFEGDTLALLFDGAKGQCFFNATVDGATTIVEVREGQTPRGTNLSGFGPGRHHLVLFKRSEASAGTARFRGIELAANARAWKSTPPDYRFRMEFIGDSITAGACNEDKDKDQWEDRGTHNSALSYATLTAHALHADYRNIAVSGMGVATGWTTVKAGEVWDRLYPIPTSPRADLAAWTPNVVLVNLGENDDSFPRAHNQSFPTNYTESYVSLIQSVRKSYPNARIVLLRGGMWGGGQSEPLRNAWETAVKQLEAADPNIRYFVFKHWTPNHPRVEDDREMAEELIRLLKPWDELAP